MLTTQKKYDYLYITANNSIMGRRDSETYTKETEGTILSIPSGSLANAKSIAMDLISKYGLEPVDIVISLNNKELKA